MTVATSFPEDRGWTTFCIRPMATIATSGILRVGEPNLPPIAPKFDTVIVPPVMSSVPNIFVLASWIRRDSSVAICHYKSCVINGLMLESQYEYQSNWTAWQCTWYWIKPLAETRATLTSSTESCWTCLMLGTTSPKLVAIATPMLCEAAKWIITIGIWWSNRPCNLPCSRLCKINAA